MRGVDYFYLRNSIKEPPEATSVPAALQILIQLTLLTMLGTAAETVVNQVQIVAVRRLGKWYLCMKMQKKELGM